MNEAQIGHHHEHSGFLNIWIDRILDNMGANEQMVQFIQHMVADSISVLAILVIVMFAVSFLRTYLNFDKLEKRLSKLKSVWGFLLATVMGVLSPFCSCTIIPVLIGLLSMGVPVVVCMCFLTSASLINLTALIAMTSVAGGLTFLYVAMSLVMIYGSCALLMLFGMNKSKYIYSFNEKVSDICECGHDHHHHHHEVYTKKAYTTKSRIIGSILETLEVFKKSWLFILIGVGLSSALLAFVPMDTIAEIINRNSNVAILLAALIGMPIHSDVFTIMPILTVLKGISVSVFITFALSTMAISVPEIFLLTRALKPKFIFVYSAIIFALSILIGCGIYLFV